jgi:dipeptidyl aminopeptidase/acylaminoacyl peptidase
MRRLPFLFCSAFAAALVSNAAAQVAPPESLVLDGIPAIPADLRESVSPYLESRAAAFQGWHPRERRILITTRFADSPQLHEVRAPGAYRRQLTFLHEPVRGASFQPRTGKFIVFSQDTGGGEFFQLYRLDTGSAKPVLLTDGKSRNTAAVWSRSGRQFAYTSTRRNGTDNDIYVMDPSDPSTDRLALQVTGGGWTICDWSWDERELLLVESISITKSHLHLLDLRSGKVRQLTPALPNDVAYHSARFSRDHRRVYVTTDRDSEFTRLVEFAFPQSGTTLEMPRRILSRAIPWDIGEVDLSHDGKLVAFIANENGVGKLHVLDLKTGKEQNVPRLPAGLLSGIQWRDGNYELGFNISSARAPLDVFSFDLATGTASRWTQSETGGLDASRFSEPELVEMKSFDGLKISAFVYRPDGSKFPGKRPVLVNIHGGPESQSRPGFLARNNYLLNELGLVLVVPNVRGSSGYGKTFLALDNGFKREDSVKDIGTVLDWIEHDGGCDAKRIAVYGGSYGGYMVLACMQHFGDRLRCGIDVVGISNFLTFLKNTQDYRRDLRRVEYGDERDEAMREFLARVSPTSNVQKLKKPLMVVQGKNDPRVPVTESEQMVKAVRDNGGPVWYMMAKDEGHGFGKKRNADYQFYAMMLFLQEYLLK